MRHFNFSDRMPGSYELYMIGDTHIGNASFKENLLKKCLRSVKASKHRYVALGGDIIDAISTDDKRFNIDSVDPAAVRISKQRDVAVDQFRSVADRILWALDGNHEFKLNKIMIITEEIMEKLEVTYDFGKDRGGVQPAYGTYMAKANMGSFKILDWHGWGGCNSRAGDQHQREMNEQIWVKRKLRDLSSDTACNIQHHGHKIRIHPPSSQLLLTSSQDGRLKASYSQPTKIKIDDEGGYYIPEEQRWYAMSGAFLGGMSEGFSSYSERFGYAPTDLGCVKVIVKNDEFQGIEKYIVRD